VTGLVERADWADIRIAKLEAENQKLRDESDQLRIENTRLKVDNQLLLDEIARLKDLPPRPPFRPSGMEQATSDKTVAGKEKPARRRGRKSDTGKVTREEVLPASVPPGSRFKGYKDCVVRDLVMRVDVVRYRRECWLTPDCRTINAPLTAGIRAGYGANRRRFCLMLHAHGQVTTQRLTTLLNDVGVEISKRQVIRFLMERLDGFHAEDAAVLHAGLVSAPFVTVDDTGARQHARPVVLALPRRSAGCQRIASIHSPAGHDDRRQNLSASTATWLGEGDNFAVVGGDLADRVEHVGAGEFQQFRRYIPLPVIIGMRRYGLPVATNDDATDRDTASALKRHAASDPDSCRAAAVLW
jgi:hypothetical protein